MNVFSGIKHFLLGRDQLKAFLEMLLIFLWRMRNALNFPPYYDFVPLPE